MSSSYGVTDWIVGYTLSDPYEYTNIQNSCSIEFKTEFDEKSKSKSNHITGYSIKVTGEYEEEVLKNEQASQAISTDYNCQKPAFFNLEPQLGHAVWLCFVPQFIQ